jgi:large subunit ribosomal protein L6
MRKEIRQEIKIPEGVNVSLEKDLLKVTGPNGVLEKEFNFAGINFEIKENNIVLFHDSATKIQKRKINTAFSHMKNMVKGVQEDFIYELKVCFAHFPITLDLKGDTITIKNFLGEKVPRTSKIVEDSNVEIKGSLIIVSSKNKESAGQTAANLEKATRIRLRDRRIFQDGIFLINKSGKNI